MYNYFLFLAFFEIIIVDRVLKNRGIELNNMEKTGTLLFILIIIQYCVLFSGNLYYLLRISFSIPILFIISYTDTKYRLVFDEDLICGIIVQVGIVLTFIIVDIVYIKRYFPIEFDCTFTEKITSLYRQYANESFEINEFTYFLKHIFFLMNDIKGNVYSVVIIFLISYTLSKATGAMGMGDVLYFSFVASFGNMNQSIFIFFVSFIASGLYCICLNILDNKSFFNGLISFTPFISVGFIVSLCI
ncbi:MAG: hypothetical protein RR561_05995 [Peptostreptococcus sp.]|uniref:hypothetical protein n=1 Tax=Peptostreptococcus sp. TaxID=1262 RepID=UPI002FC6327D